MVALVGNMTSVRYPLNWMLLFTRQPEPDLEFTEEELDQTSTLKARGPVNPRKKSGGGSPLLWILLLALVGGIAYVSMQPELFTEWLSPYLGESTPAPMAMKSKPSAPAPIVPAPTPQAVPGPNNGASAPVTPVTPPASGVSPPAPAVVSSPQTAVRPAGPVAPASDPMFSGGQRVTVTVDDTAPGGSISLFTDSSSSKPGPIVRPGVSLTVLDGDLQPSGWLYLVRADDGVTGWVSEKRLRLKF